MHHCLLAYKAWLCAGTALTLVVRNQYNTYAFGGAKVSSASDGCLSSTKLGFQVA